MKIDLKQIIEKMEMSKKEVATELFPVNKFPVLALNRVLAGEAVLDADQISKLSMLSGLSPNEMFSSWKMKSRMGIHTLTSGNYRADLDMHSGTTKIFYKGSLDHEFIIHKTNIELSEFINMLNTKIEE